MVQIRNLEDGDMITVSLQHHAVWDRSEFPHKLITVDRDANNEVIGFAALGRFIQPALEAYAAWRKTNTSPEVLVGRLRAIELVDEGRTDLAYSLSADEMVSEVERRCGGRLRPKDREAMVGVVANIIAGFQARIDQQKPVSIDDALVEEALQTYEAEYRRIYPTGGDEADHQEAVRSGIAAAVALVQQKAQVPS